MTARRTDMHKLQEAVRLHRLGQSRRAIARQLQIGRETLTRYLVAFEHARLLDGDAIDLPDAGRLRAIAEELVPSKKPLQMTSSIERWQRVVRVLPPSKRHAKLAFRHFQGLFGNPASSPTLPGLLLGRIAVESLKAPACDFWLKSS